MKTFIDSKGVSLILLLVITLSISKYVSLFVECYKAFSDIMEECYECLGLIKNI